MSQVQAVPQGYASVIPYLTIKNAAKAIEFYQQAFGAEQTERMDMPSGEVMHAEMRIGPCLFMLSEQNDQWGSKSPEMLNGSPVSMMIYVNDVDAVVKRAEAAGAKVTMPVADQFYGDRMGCLQDPFGHSWMFATHIEDVSKEEMMQRAKAMFGQ